MSEIIPATCLLQAGKLPKHIAIIMDGNGRWARQHNRSRIWGHQAGAKTVREIVRECARLGSHPSGKALGSHHPVYTEHSECVKDGIQQLTLYAFSTENWKRPPSEVNFLMRLLKRYLVKERPELAKNNIRFAAIGRIAELPPAVQQELAKTIELSAANTGMTLCLALNYGGRVEIIDAVKKMCQAVKEGNLSVSKIDTEVLRQYLYKPEMPDPDLLIRTGGEMRISNFFLWEIAYTELWVTPALWPDFDKKHLHEALQDYARRERRFGGV